MKNYKFLLKPIFFIFSLLFATWLVFEIESLKPSDFRPYKKMLIISPKKTPAVSRCMVDRRQLFEICKSYKAGLLDSSALDNRLRSLLDSATIDKPVAGQTTVLESGRTGH